MSCEYNGHHGILNTKTNEVYFYNLVFENIIFATRFLKDLEPGDGNYRGWVIGSLYGVYDKHADMYFTNTRGWVSPTIYEMMVRPM